MYTGGDRCEGSNGARQARETELRIACSPDEEPHLLMREPVECQYIMVLYDPGLCNVAGHEAKPDDIERAEL